MPIVGAKQDGVQIRLGDGNGNPVLKSGAVDTNIMELDCVIRQLFQDAGQVSFLQTVTGFIQMIV